MSTWQRATGILSASLAVALFAGFASTGAASAAWTLQTSGTTINLLGISCPSTGVCGAVGALSGVQPAITFTQNGGASWATDAGIGGAQLNAISCSSAANCFMAGNGGTILYTNGLGLTQQTSGATVNLQGLACASATVCWAVGAVNPTNGVILATTTGGTTWATQTSTGGQQLNAIACPSTTSCWAVGNGGVILHSANGTSWSAQTSGVTVPLLGVACASTSVCWAVGAVDPTNGVILATTNGGTTWSAQTSTGGAQLNSVECADTTHCLAVGNGGLALATTNGTSWSSQASTTTDNLDAVQLVTDSLGWAAGVGGTIDAYVAPCSGGALSAPAPNPVTFPSTALNGSNQTVSTTTPLTVNDETGSGAGWNLDLTSTTFTTTGSKTLPTTAATVTGASSVAGTGNCSLPTNSVTYPVTVPAATTAPAAAKIFDAAAATGAGPATVTLALSLAVPARSYVGSYNSTWTFTDASGP
jgi:WxL domain surface cell wall-binding